MIVVVAFHHLRWTEPAMLSASKLPSTNSDKFAEHFTQKTKEHQQEATTASMLLPVPTSACHESVHLTKEVSDAIYIIALVTNTTKTS